MTIAYPAFNLYCELEECTVLNLVIENQQIFSDVISDIYDQCSSVLMRSPPVPGFVATFRLAGCVRRLSPVGKVRLPNS